MAPAPCIEGCTLLCSCITYLVQRAWEHWMSCRDAPSQTKTLPGARSSHSSLGPHVGLAFHVDDNDVEGRVEEVSLPIGEKGPARDV